MNVFIIFIIFSVGVSSGHRFLRSPVTPRWDLLAQFLTTVGGDNGDANDTAEPTDASRLFDHLLNTYNRAVRPVRHARTAPTTVVKVGLTLNNILDLDEKTQELITNVWVTQEWNDELLRWDPNEFGGIDRIKLPSDSIWLPDIILYNNADDYNKEDDFKRFRVMCTSDGDVYWAMPTRLKSTCKIDVTYFPFESQHCHLRFGSWLYDASELDVTNRTLGVNLKQYVVSGEFDLVTVHQKRREVSYPNFKTPFPEMVFYIHLRRNTLYYLYTVILPCMLISALTSLVFCLPPDSPGEKIALGVTVLLAFSVFLIAVGNKLPEASQSIPLIGIYFSVVMGLTSVTVVMTVVVLRIDNAAETGKSVPAILQWLVLGKLRRLLRMKLPHRFAASRHSTIRKPTAFANANGAALASNNACVSRLSTIRKATASPPHANDAASASNYAGELLKETTFEMDLRRSTEYTTGELLEQLILEMRKLLALHEAQLLVAAGDAEMDDEDDWRKSARVLDRLLFWTFIGATVGVTLLLLVVVPLVARHPAIASAELLDDRLYGLTPSVNTSVA